MTQLIIILTLLIIIRVLTAMIVFSRPALWTCTPICTRWTYFTNYCRPTFSSKYLELLALYSTFLPWRPPKSKLHSILTSARNTAGHRPKSLLDQVTPSQGPQPTGSITKVSEAGNLTRWGVNYTLPQSSWTEWEWNDIMIIITDQSWSSASLS